MHQTHISTELLSAYLDGQLTEGERSTVNGHLASCRVCREDMESLRRTVDLLRAVPPPRLPRTFLIEQGAAPARLTPLARGPIALRALSAIAAAAMVVLLVGDVAGLVGGAWAPSVGVPGPPLAGLRAAPPSESQQDRVAPAGDAVQAERPRAAPAPARSEPAPAAEAPASEALGAPPDAGLAREPAAPAVGQAFSAPPAPTPAARNGRSLEAQPSLGEEGAAPVPRDEVGAPAPPGEPPRSAERAPAPAMAWPRVAAIALGVLALALWLASLRLKRSG